MDDTKPIHIPSLQSSKPEYGGTQMKGTKGAGGVDFKTPGIPDPVEETQRKRAIVMVRNHAKDAVEAREFFQMLGLIE